METEDSVQLLPRGLWSSPSVPRIPRKPVPLARSYDSSYGVILSDSNGHDQNTSSYSKLQFQDQNPRADFSDAAGSGIGPPPQALKGYFNLWQSWWLYEVLAVAFSVSAMTALLGVLKGYSGQSVQQMPLGITLNGIVAVLATICRTSLMVPIASGLSQGKWTWFSAHRASRDGKRLEDLETFDRASRGAWGSLQLVWRLKARYIATFGCLVTILTLAFDAFTQQVLSTQYQNTLVPASSLQLTLDVLRSENYTISSDADNESDRIPDWPTYAAIYNGILASKTSFLPVTCATGNCTWPVIPSLGVCGSCQTSTWIMTGNCGPGADTNYTSDSACNYTLPDGQYISVVEGDPVNVFQVMRTKGTIYNSSSTTIPYFLNFEAIGMPFESNFWTSSNISARECALWFCIQAYNISVTSNVLNQTVIYEWDTIEPLNRTDISGADMLEFTNIPPYMNTHSNSSYFVGFLSLVAANNALGSIFSGVAAGGAEGIEYSTEFIEAVWSGWDNMDQLISNLARSMTNNIRQTSAAAPYPMYAGSAYREVLLVHVRWVWLLLPVALVLCSIVFLVLVILQTRSSGVNAWKSSALALLFSDVEHNLKETSRYGVDRPDGLLKAAGKSRVVLREIGGFLEFKNSMPFPENLRDQNIVNQSI